MFKKARENFVNQRNCFKQLPNLKQLFINGCYYCDRKVFKYLTKNEVSTEEKF